jgi:CRISPR-associated endonuclease Cas1
MAASHNLPQLPNSSKSPISKSGVLTIHGFGVRVRMQSGHLEIEDGVGSDRRTLRLPRVNRLKRLVCISEDGFTTLSALKWLADVGASFVFLNRTGKVLFVTGPTAPSDARLRRAHALAIANGVGLEISRTLIDAKLKGQERLIRERLHDSVAAQEIATFGEKLSAADTVEMVRMLEAHAAISYFGAWRNVPVLWPKADLRRIPDHWRTVGSRHSPLSGGPRLAVTPVHAILNYCFALLESESSLALSALGLDPGLGVGLHTDTPNRDSLALDVLEPVRPQVEAWVFDWITHKPLRRADFFETTNGNCRLMAHFCAKLSETAPTWGKLVAPWAEYVARSLWRTTHKPTRRAAPATRLTQHHRRQAKGGGSTTKVSLRPRPPSICRGCGVSIKFGKSYCATCGVTVSREGLIEAAKLGRIAGHSPEARARQAEKQRQHAAAVKSWLPSDKPEWLTKEVFRGQIQPRLAALTVPSIASALGISEPYASLIRAKRYLPHPRHWLPLAQLVGVMPRLCKPRPCRHHRVSR